MECEPKTVIVVEDEPLVRMVAADILSDAGYQVIEAEDAAEAVAILERQAACVSVLFTDVHMPGKMDGDALAYHAHLHWPWIKVLVASGKARPGTNELPTDSLFLAKPYTAQHVVDRVAALVR